MRPEEGKNGASRAPARRSCLWSSGRIRGRVLPPKGGTMDAKDLLWFSSGFRTVEAWRDAMCAHGYRVPMHLCHGLHEAMQRRVRLHQVRCSTSAHRRPCPARRVSAPAIREDCAASNALCLAFSAISISSSE